MITKAIALTLRHGEILHHVSQKNADGSPQRWRVSGRCQTWKRDPNRFRLPIKHGLYNHDAVTETTADLLCLPVEIGERAIIRATYSPGNRLWEDFNIGSQMQPMMASANAYTGGYTKGERAIVEAVKV